MAGQLAGCHSPKQIKYLGDADLKYYKNTATEIAYPHVHEQIDPTLQYSERPATVRDPAKMPVYELPLSEALQLALNNSKVVRARGAFKSPANPLMTSPERVASSYDTAIQETSAGFFQRGPEAALSAFDAQFKTSVSTGHSDVVQNNLLLGAIGPGQTLEIDTGNWQTSLQKAMADGGMFTVTQDWSYSQTNQFFQLFPSTYRGYLRADYRKPLWAGAGVDFTRIAGPVTRSIPGLSLTDGGVLISRINTDITIADTELNVINLVRDVEDLYWELYLAYRTYDAQLAARDAAHSVWRSAVRRMESGSKGGTVVDEAQARQAYFANRINLENAVGTLYSTEGQLRRLIGLPVNDGRMLRPADEPLEAEFVSDWRMALSESLVRRVELRRQKWQIKSLELQMSAAESLAKPRLDVIGGYQLNGFGDDLLAGTNDDGITQRGYASAYGSLFRGDQASWDVGLEFSLPIGLRQALAHQRNIEFRLIKARSVLAAQELEISHELSNSVQLLDWWYQVAESNLHRGMAAETEVNAVEKEYSAGRIPVDLLLRSQAAVAAAKVGYYNALVKYNQALVDFRARKGSLLDDNNIHMAEGGWAPAAYDEALRRAWARSYAFDNDKLETEPPEFSFPVPPTFGVIGLPPETEGSAKVLAEPPPAPASEEPAPTPVPTATEPSVLQ
ncbi:MAG TPA: TolC family protein [Planctomycetaceae bacterium]|nr:TolC family protein [Planctomycetaceae bacterium]